MDEIAAPSDNVVRQAWKTAAEYLDHAIEQVDVRFGDGYSKKNPELVAAMMRASAIDLLAMTNAAALERIAEAIAARE